MDETEQGASSSSTGGVVDSGALDAAPDNAEENTTARPNDDAAIAPRESE